MAIDPNDVQLTAAQRRLVAELAEREGRSPQDVLADLIAPAEVRRRNGSRTASTESAHKLGKRLGLYAALEDGPSDLSTNSRYMEGFGQHADRTGTD
jgi:hypothetical protein